MKKIILLSASLLAIASLTACATSNVDKKISSSNSLGSSAVKASSDVKTESNTESSTLEKIASWAEKSISTDELYVTGDMNVGLDDSIKPGIYDMEILGGEGNIHGKHDGFHYPFNNYTAGAPETRQLSKIRVLNFKGDVWQFSNISKVKFTAVPTATPQTEFYIGSWIVGRDINPGIYKLQSSQPLSAKNSTEGWRIAINDFDDASLDHKVKLTTSSPDVAVELREGNIVTIALDIFGIEDRKNARLQFIKQ
ncbi:hypothetical protein RyT2_06790 [Pseudolactococcus yaeyamensis]